MRYLVGLVALLFCVSSFATIYSNEGLAYQACLADTQTGSCLTTNSCSCKQVVPSDIEGAGYAVYHDHVCNKTTGTCSDTGDWAWMISCTAGQTYYNVLLVEWNVWGEWLLRHVSMGVWWAVQ